MDLFNMENITRIHEFYKKILIFQATVLKFGEYGYGCCQQIQRFSTNISKIAPAK